MMPVRDLSTIIRITADVYAYDSTVTAEFVPEYGDIDIADIADITVNNDKLPGTRTKKQTIAIIWNFIGAVDIPEEVRKTA